MKLRVLSLTLICLLLVGLCCGCDRAVEQDPDVVEQQVSHQETVYIGVLCPLSGADGDWGADMQAALEVAAAIVNESHELDWPLAADTGIAGYGNARVELLFADDQNNALTAQTQAQALIDQGVTALLADGNAPAVQEVRKLADAAGLPLLCASCYDSLLLRTPTPGFVRLAMTPEQENAQFFAYLKYLDQTQNVQIGKLSIAYTENAYGREVLELFNAAAADNGFEVVARIGFQPGSKDVSLEISRMLANKPDAIFQVGDVDDLSRFAKGYAESQYDLRLMLCYQGGYQETDFVRTCTDLGVSWIAGSTVTPESRFASGSLAAAEDTPVIIVEEAAPEPEETVYNETYEYINKLYREKTGHNMDDAALLQFASLIVLTQAIGSTGSSDRSAWSETLHTQTFDAPYLESGSVAFGENGQNTVPPAYLSTIRNGSYLRLY